MPSDRERASDKARKERRYNAGMCVQCGTRPRKELYQRCTRCSERNTAQRIAREALKIVSGLCKFGKCSNIPKAGRQHCQKCINKLDAAHRAQFITNRENGWCLRCPPGTPVVPGRSMCEYHRAKNAAYDRHYRSKKLKAKESEHGTK